MDGQKGHMWPLFPLHFGPAIGQKVEFTQVNLNTSI